MPALTYVRFEKRKPLETKNPQEESIPKLSVRLITSQQDNEWSLDKWGVLGLSPQGSFFSYLRRVYSDSESFSLALKHSLVDEEAENELMKFEIQIYLNPLEEKHYRSKDVLGTFPIDTQADYWYVEGSIGLGDTAFQYDNQKMCLSTYGNELFGVIDFITWCEKVNLINCLTSGLVL